MSIVQVGTNDASSKPIKVNKWDTNAVKNALDDACKKVGFASEKSEFHHDFLVVF